jgi:predicted nucleic acid-binding protein
VKVAVTDASIFIDLIEIGWIRHLPMLDFEIVTTYMVVAELHDWQQIVIEEIVKTQGLFIHPVPDDALNKWSESLGMTKRLSRPDMTVLWLAAQMEAMVLTGDKLMRTVSTKLNLETHGVLWLFEQCIEKQLVTHLEACTGLEALMETNDRLPREACHGRLNAWRAYCE